MRATRPLHTHNTMAELPVSVDFTFWRGYPATREEPGEDDEVAIEAVRIGELNVTDLVADSLLEEIAKECLAGLGEDID